MRHITSGLIMPKKDRRDFKYSKVFGAAPLGDIPDFVVKQPLEIKDQGVSDACTAFALCSVSEDQEDTILEPAYQFAKTRQKMGNWQSWGADPRSALKAICEYGSLEKAVSPYSFDKNGRNFVANWTNWDPKLDGVAGIHKKKSYFDLDGHGDRFDSIRSILYENMGTTHNSAFCGIYWQHNWGPIVDLPGPDKSLPHAIKIFGQKTINGKPYLIVQNSWGAGWGDGGLFYFSREVVNSLEFAYGVFDISPDDVKKVAWSFLDYLYHLLMKFLIGDKSAPNPPPTPPTLTEDTKMIPKPIPNYLKKFADAIEDFEVWAAPGETVRGQFYQNGSRSWNNKNPGNLKYTTYTASLGAISHDSGGYCVFPNPDAGYSALCQFITDAANDELRDYHNCTIKTFFQSYSDNSLNYANFVADKLKVDINTPLKSII